MVKAAKLTMALLLGAAAASPSHAFLYWKEPAYPTTPVSVDEPGLALPLANANAKEKLANLVWSMRAGLNVAALQCQFSPVLRTVPNYNHLLRQHAAELEATRSTLAGYFRRTGGKTWQTAFDQYTTRTYNGFSTLHAQLSFCEAAADIGRDALARRVGQLHEVATARMRAFRGSLVPVGDSGLLGARQILTLAAVDVSDYCFNKKGRQIRCKNR